MASMDVEHKQLAEEWQAKEVNQKPIIQKAESNRLVSIQTAKAELEAYRAKIEPDVKKKEEARQAAIKVAEAKVKSAYDLAPSNQPKWENYLDLSTEWHPLEVKVQRAGGVEKIDVLPDGSLLASALPEGKQSAGNYLLIGKSILPNITAIKLEMLPDDRLPNNGPGLAPDGNFVLGEFIVTTQPADARRSRSTATAQILKRPIADFEQTNFSIAEALKKGNRDRGWAVSPDTGYRHEAIFSFEKPVKYDGGTSFSVQMISNFQNGKYNPGRFRLWVTNSPVVRFGVPSVIAASLKAEQRTAEAKALFMQHFLHQFRDYQTQKKAWVNARKPLPIDPQIISLESKYAESQKPIPLDPKLIQLRRDADLSSKQLANRRLTHAQDLAWALINSPAFLFNH
jgi:hypothetical protein